MAASLIHPHIMTQLAISEMGWLSIRMALVLDTITV